MARFKKVSIEKLAEMVQRGFDDVTGTFHDVTSRMAHKIDVDKRFDGVDKRFDALKDRLERIEKLMLADHKRRIERLESEMKELRDLLAIKEQRYVCAF